MRKHNENLASLLIHGGILFYNYYCSHDGDIVSVDGVYVARRNAG